MKRLLADLAAGTGDPIARIIELARRHLQMDVVFVAEFSDGKRVTRAIGGDAESFALTVGDGPSLATTYCNLLAAGAVATVVTDARTDARVSALPTDGDVGAYIGVPLVLPDGEIYGSFCCLSHDTSETLSDRDVKFMQMLADLMVDHIAANRVLASEHDEIRQIIDGGQFVTALQPIVRISDGRWLGFEALSRFTTGARPDVVFAAAERAGLGVELEVATAAGAVELLPLLGERQYLSINASPGLILGQAAGAVDIDLPWHRVVSEVTEREDVEDYAELSRQLQPLRDLGMRIAIDDAGAGYASLHHIAQLHPDIIKIDRSLVAGVADDAARRSIITGFCALARDLDATLVAEGVERQVDLDVLARLGVDAAQGYLLAKPTTDLGALLRPAAMV
ncbi:MAG: EAL domain-containing protein [Frankiaceae bacterium]|nr:EAL domain-containing protein [Frankiaceae bacterium]